MIKLTRTQIGFLTQFTDEQLRAQFDNIGRHTDHVVKSGRNKGQTKIASAKYGDVILAELRRRRANTSVEG